MPKGNTRQHSERRGVSVSPAPALRTPVLQVANEVHLLCHVAQRRGAGLVLCGGLEQGVLACGLYKRLRDGAYVGAVCCSHSPCQRFRIGCSLAHTKQASGRACASVQRRLPRVPWLGTPGLRRRMQTRQQRRGHVAPPGRSHQRRRLWGRPR